MYIGLIGPPVCVKILTCIALKAKYDPRNLLSQKHTHHILRYETFHILSNHWMSWVSLRIYNCKKYSLIQSAVKQISARRF